MVRTKNRRFHVLTNHRRLNLHRCEAATRERALYSARTLHCRLQDADLAPTESIKGIRKRPRVAEVSKNYRERLDHKPFTVPLHRLGEELFDGFRVAILLWWRQHERQKIKNRRQSFLLHETNELYTRKKVKIGRVGQSPHCYGRPFSLFSAPSQLKWINAPYLCSFLAGDIQKINLVQHIQTTQIYHQLVHHTK